ncbi:cell cycle checkpoint protein RAD17 [Procambarus clarkii]|nr:cell cycle checkpoint protein RAD17-like [Procambarus clarkii]
MANKKSRQMISSWVTPTFDDFDLNSSPPTEKKARKRHREPNALSRLGKKTHQGGTVLWVDLYAPMTREDLSVHKKKVQEVESWLVESMAGMKGRRFLLLTGPAGCGKSATVRVLAKEAGLNFVEWINPTTANNSSFLDQENTWIPGDSVRSASQTSLFWDFLIRASKYNSVCGTGKEKNLVCVEDFPNTFLRDASLLQTMLRRYNQRSIGSPVVFILTDSTHQQSSAKHLFPPEVQQELSVINITFNPIASGLLVKALNRVVSMESARDEGRGSSLPSRDALQVLAETSGGDIRSAINSLQFAVKKDVHHLEGLFTGSSTVGRTSTRTKSQSKHQPRKSAAAKLDDNGVDGFATVGGKDASLFLFRALGKVLYCKRNQDVGVVEPLPKHLQLNERTPLQENPESIYENTSMGAASFSVFLHHNCLAFFSDIDSAGQALQHLTDSDVLAAEWTGREVLEDYAASVTIRGLMHANKGSSSGGGWRPFTRPQWYKAHKEGQQNVLYLKNEHRMASLTSEELTTVFVPMKAKILTAEGKGHFSLTKEVGLFSEVHLKTTSERLGEVDADASITEDEVREVVPRNVSLPYLEAQEPGVNNQDDDPDEDFRIEEFEDD